MPTKPRIKQNKEKRVPDQMMEINQLILKSIHPTVTFHFIYILMSLNLVLEMV